MTRPPPPLGPHLFSTIIARLRCLWIAPDEVRRETWALGARHRGEVLVGAQLETKTPGLPLRQAILLQAVIRSEKIAARVRGRSPQPQPRKSSDERT